MEVEDFLVSFDIFSWEHSCKMKSGSSGSFPGREVERDFYTCHTPHSPRLCCAAGYDGPPSKLKSGMLGGGGFIIEISHSAGVHREVERDFDLSLELSQRLSGSMSGTELFSRNSRGIGVRDNS